jgi:uncharacterized protein (DUF697 family)
MPGASDLINTWNTIKEVDLRPLRQQALKGVRITLVGAPGSGREALAAQLRRDPSHPDITLDTPLHILDLQTGRETIDADLIILLVDEAKADIDQERALVQAWANRGNKVLIFISESPAREESLALPGWKEWHGSRVVHGSPQDTEFLVKRFAPAVIDLVPDKLLGLGRIFPLFRVPAAHYLINDACLSNAAYSLTTGLAEIVPVFDVPLNVADMIVLSKTQAFLAYKLGLALGFSTRWQDYLSEFGGVLGGGFLWRQLARSLVGLIPVWGIVPKVAVAYAGTYVVGNTILQWYLTGKHLSTRQMRELYVEALARGKNAARKLLKREAGEKQAKPRPVGRRFRLPGRSKKALPANTEVKTCPVCGKESAVDAGFCQYCGQAFEGEASGAH